MTRYRRGNHLDSLDALLAVVDYACEHAITGDISESHDFELPPELPRAEFHEFLETTTQHEDHVSEPLGLVCSQHLDFL